MAQQRSRLLLGCGVGCGLVIVVLVVLSLAGSFYVSRFFSEAREAGRSWRELVSAHGEAEQFVPAPDGAVPAERVELFLSVRESLREPQARLHAVFADFPPDDMLEEKRAFFVIVGALRGIAGLIGPIATYIDERNRALLAAGMGPGEYAYIYGTAYYSWLGHSPADGPLITKDTGEPWRAGAPPRLFDDPDSSFGPGQVRRRYRRCTLAMLRNQLAALPQTGLSEDGEAWRTGLAAEIRRFESRPDAVAWEKGLPPAVEASLEPFRARFAATWDAATNPLEFPRRDAGSRRRPG